MIINAENEKTSQIAYSFAADKFHVAEIFSLYFYRAETDVFPFREGKSRRKAREKSSGGGGEVRMDESAEMDDKSTNI